MVAKAVPDSAVLAASKDSVALRAALADTRVVLEALAVPVVTKAVVTRADQEDTADLVDLRAEYVHLKGVECPFR
jgi:hypothetical protein